MNEQQPHSPEFGRRLERSVLEEMRALELKEQRLWGWLLAGCLLVWAVIIAYVVWGR